MAKGAVKHFGNSLLEFVTVGMAGTANGAKNASSTVKEVKGAGFWASIGGFFSDMLDTGSEMLTGRDRNENKTALGTVMRPVLYIMAAVGIYKLVNAAMDYFGVRSERKKAENANEAVKIHADNMARMAAAEEMRMQADAMEAELAAAGTTFRDKFPSRASITDFRSRVEQETPELALGGRQN